MRHLDPESWKALSAGDREAQAYFTDHLKTVCDPCEEFLARQEPGLLDGAADAWLIGARPAAVDQLGFRKVMREVRPARSRRSMFGAAIGVAAAAAIAVLVLPQVQQRSDDGIKGVTAALQVELSVVQQRPDGALAPVPNDAPLPADAVLLFRYRANADGQGAIVLERADGTSEVLAEFAMKAGVHDVERDGAPLGVTVSDEGGEVRLRLVARPGTEPLDRDALTKSGPTSRSGWAESGILVHVERSR